MTEYEEVPVGGPALKRYLTELRRTRTNGDAILARFRVSGAAPGPEWFWTSSNVSRYQAFRDFFGAPAVHKRLRKVLGDDPFPSGKPPEFHESTHGALTLEGELAVMLVAGGAYRKFKGSHAEAKALAAAAVHELVEDRYEDFTGFYSGAAWTPWFCDIAWDVTIILLDRGRTEVTILCSTDSD